MQRLRTLLIASAVLILLGGDVASAQNAPKAAPVKVAESGWGEPKDGLRIGLFLENQGRVFRYGDILTFALRVRNVGETDFECMIRAANQSTFSLAAGNQLRREGLFGDPMPFRLVPGQEADIPGGKFAVRLLPLGDKAPPGIAGVDATPIALLPGKYTFECAYPIWMADADDSSRATAHRAKPGTLSFTLLPDPGKSRVRPPLLRDNDQPTVTWGETVNGLQSGIAPAREARIGNRPNDKIAVEYWVRNTTDKTLALSYPNLGRDSHPNITREDGSHVPINMVYSTGLREMMQRTLKPGESLVIGTSSVRLLPVGKQKDEGDFSPTMTAEPGKYNASANAAIRFTGLDWFHIVLVTPTLPFTLPARN
jgi:hypothetical protein